MISIPEALSVKLRQDVDVNACVINSVAILGPWLRENRTLFFPEYTDHGLRHIEEVLVSAAELITEESHKLISPADAGVLVISVLLHDCALHITEDGFREVISGRWAPVSSLEDEKPWEDLWKDFMAEAVRFDGRKLKSLFGTIEPVRPPSETSYDSRDILLIGEFLRRHHPRLARDIAFKGVPGPRGSGLQFPIPTEVDYIRNLSALVAESHGMPLRQSLARLDPEFDRREFRKVHALYLMCVLRVADYIQIHAGRAPSQLLQIKSLQSPTSKREWAAHASILDLRTTHDDPEAIYVQASPKSAIAYFRVKDWLTGIQSELDTCWAVMGEIYGRYSHLAGFGLTIRRIRSNLEDSLIHSKSLPFALIDARFRAADSDLLKLLVAPLYGDRPDVGIRELMQNSIDAVRERRAHSFADASHRDYSVSISIRKTEAGGIVEISDLGSGMNLKILRDYFLTAGASYRKSEEWKREYSDATGHSRVLRAGRFGVGALAAFLLGDRIQVSTRHRDEKHGYEFEAGIEDEVLEIRKIAREVGTTIRIQIPDAVYNKLREGEEDIFGRQTESAWHWYCLSDPKVIFTLDGEIKEQQCILPLSGAEMSPGWHRLKTKDFEDVHWTFESAPGLVCNGILISRAIVPLWPPSSGLNCPNLSIFDPDGSLPVNLQRTGLTNHELSFRKALFESVAELFFAEAFVSTPLSRPKGQFRARFHGMNSDYSSRSDGYRDYSSCRDWIITLDGIAYLDAGVLSAIGSDGLAVIRFREDTANESKPFSYMKPFVATNPERSVSSSDYNLRWSFSTVGAGLDTSPDKLELWNILVISGVAGVRVFVSKQFWLRVVEGPTSARLPKYIVSGITVERELGPFVILKKGKCPPLEEGFVKLCEGAVADEFNTASEFYLSRTGMCESSEVGALYLKAIPKGIIPYNVEERGKLLHSMSDGFRELVERVKAAQAAVKK